MNEAIYGDSIKDGIYRCYVIHPDLDVYSIAVKEGKIFLYRANVTQEIKEDDEYLKLYFNDEYRNKIAQFARTYD